MAPSHHSFSLKHSVSLSNSIFSSPKAFKASLSLSGSKSSSINDVTKSFAASLALANSKVIDLSDRISGSQGCATQSYLVAKPLTSEPPSLSNMKRFSMTSSPSLSFSVSTSLTPWIFRHNLSNAEI